MFEALKEFIKSVDPDSDLTQLYTTKEILDELNFAQGQKPKAFANSIGHLIEIVETYVLQVNNNEKNQLVDIIIMSIQVYPSTIRKNTNRIERLFDLICRIMANISFEVPQIWFDLPQDYSQQDLVKLEQLDSDGALVCKMRSCFDRLSNIVGYMKMVKLIESKAINLYKNGDWRWKNAILMCLSQLTQDIELQKIDNVLSLIKMGFYDLHPKVRFAAIQGLGQLSDDLKPQFQNKYFKQLMPIIIKGFDDSVQRVAAHWMACMTNFIEDFTNTTEIMPFLEPLMSKICYFIQYGHNVAKQNSISTLSSLVTIPSLFDKETIRKPFQICHSIFQVFTIQKHKQLINQTVQCLTITISSQPYAIIKDYIIFAVEIINQICHKISPEYLITGWHRICSVGQKFQNWKPIFSKIFQIIKTLEISEQKAGFDAILCTVDCFKEDFYPFANEILPYLQNSLIKALEQVQQQITISAINAIEQILTKAKPTNPDVSWDNIIKTTYVTYTQKVMQTINNDYFHTCQKMLESIKQLFVNYSHLFSEHQMMNQYHHYWHIIQKLQLKKSNIINNVQSLQDQQQLDSDVLKEKNQVDLKGINDCKLSIPDIIQSIMKKSSSQNFLIPNVLEHISHAIVNALDEQDLRYATYYIDNLLQDYDYETLKQNWAKIYEYLSNFSGKNQASLRNSAIFGVGVLAEKTPFQLVTMYTINTWIQVAKAAFSKPKNQNQSKRAYGHCQDNCVATIGKILKRYHKVYDLKHLYQKWLISLPLKYDHEENRIQINHLCDLLEKEPQILIDGQNQSIKTLKQIFKVFAQLVCHLRKKKLNLQNSLVLKRCKEILLVVNTWPIYKQNQMQIISSLGYNQQFQLKQLLTNQSILENK